MIGGNTLKVIIVTSLVFSITLSGCGKGGSGGSRKSPSIQVLPSVYDFGPVTPGNSPAPLYVKITNTGTETLNISNISLQDKTNFTLNLNGGSKACGSASLTLPAGDRCTVEIGFQPQSTASFSTNLTINSNDPSTSAFKLPLSGRQEDISTLNVRNNQVAIACPSGVVTAYVSVTDQGGYPVATLTKDDFSITETSGYAGPPASSPLVENNATISAALVMDYSSSITELPDSVRDMEEGAVSFVNLLGANDEAEIIRFSSIVEVVQSFTDNKNLLISAIRSTWKKLFGTAFLDAGKTAVDNTSIRSKDRKAVVVITDGIDNSSVIGVNNLINYALSKNVPLFTVGIGDNVNAADLNKLADYTGGRYSEAPYTENLYTVYQQLAHVLFSYQYILTYNSGLANGTTANLRVGATLPLTAIEGSYTKSITKCP